MQTDKQKQTIDTYNQSAREMAVKFNAIGARMEDIARALSFVDKENPTVLEIGCGNGRDAAEILKSTDNYTGIDPSEGFIKIAKETASQGTFIVSDAENFDYPESMDIVFSFASLLHSDKESLKGVFQKVHKALNEGGVSYISLKHGEYEEFVKEDEFGTRTFYYYSPELIEELAGDNYKTLYKNIHELREQKWFTIVLQKV